MAGEKSYTKKLFLRLTSDGQIALDEEYMWDGCDTPEIDPDIELAPVPLQKLTQLLSKLYLAEPEKEDIDRLKKTLSEINACGDILDKAIKTLEAKFPT